MQSNFGLRLCLKVLWLTTPNPGAFSSRDAVSWDSLINLKLDVKSSFCFEDHGQDRWQLRGADEDGRVFTVVVAPIKPDILVFTVIR